MPLVEAAVEESGRESTGRIKDAMAALVARWSSLRSVEATVQSCSTLEAEAEAGAAETTESGAQHEEGEEKEEERSVAFFLTEAIVKGSQARQIHRSKPQYNLLTYSKTFSVFFSLFLPRKKLQESWEKLNRKMKKK